MKRHKTVDDYIASVAHWQAELERLRQIVASTPLEETVKWGAPCYTHNGKNVVGIGAFKSYVGLWFHQGALLGDPEGVLINAQEGKTRALRQWRFTSNGEIKARIIKAYIKEAIELVEQGKEIKPDRSKPIVIPDELKAAFRKNTRAKSAFGKLSKSCQREYAEHVGDAKREETRVRRVEKIIPMILEGAGLNDKYRC
ncbi:MAG: YdeI family protein [Phycisphaerales bacterium JB043]